MDRKEIPPIGLGKLRGNWNRDPAGPRPRIVPAPFGMPFGAPPPPPPGPLPLSRRNGDADRKEVPPLQLDKVRGNWNRGPWGPRPKMVPAPFGIPFAHPRLPAPPRFPTDE